MKYKANQTFIGLLVGLLAFGGTSRAWAVNFCTEENQVELTECTVQGAACCLAVGCLTLTFVGVVSGTSALCGGPGSCLPDCLNESAQAWNHDCLFGRGRIITSIVGGALMGAGAITTCLGTAANGLIQYCIERSDESDTDSESGSQPTPRFSSAPEPGMMTNSIPPLNCPDLVRLYDFAKDPMENHEWRQIPTEDVLAPQDPLFDSVKIYYHLRHEELSQESATKAAVQAFRAIQSTSDPSPEACSITQNDLFQNGTLNQSMVVLVHPDGNHFFDPAGLTRWSRTQLPEKLERQEDCPVCRRNFREDTRILLVQPTPPRRLSDSSEINLPGSVSESERLSLSE